MAEILTGLWTAMEICSANFLWNAFFQCKAAKRRYVLSLTLLWVCWQALFAFQPGAWVKMAIVVVSYTICSLLNYQGAWHQHLLLAIICMLLYSAADNIVVYGTSILFGTPVSVMTEDAFLYGLTVTAAKTVEVCISWCVYHFQREQKIRALGGKWLIFTLLSSAFSVATLYAIAYAFRGTGAATPGVILLSAATVATTLVLLYLVQSLATATERLQESSLLFQQVELMSKQIQALEQSNRTQREQTHDFRNHLRVIRGLLDAGEGEKAQSVIDELLGGATARIFAVRTCNPILDALLNQKYQEARSAGVDMQLWVNDLSQLPLPEDLMIVLLSNLLDNAIEGSLRTGEDVYKEVLVTLVKEEDTVFLAVQNPSLPVELRNGRSESSKPDKLNHGFGLGKINTILSILQASSSMRCTNGQFRFAAEIPINPPA